MGLEQKCRASWPGGSGDVKALLETHELILRGDVKRSFPIARLANIRVDAENLRFRAADEEIALTLGAEIAGRWAKKLTTPPPSLAQKLGVGPTSKALVIGEIDDAALSEALGGNIVASPEEARLCVAVVRDEEALRQALLVQQSCAFETLIWIANVKGPRSPFGDNAVRSFMRNAGYIDNKVSAVSDILSATRYARRR
jgi:hypothetical protein